MMRKVRDEIARKFLNWSSSLGNLFNLEVSHV